MSVSAFSPLSVAGCKLWLDASAPNSMYQSGTRAAPGTIASSGTVIGLWLDQSGNNNDVSQSTTNNKPTYQAGAFTWPSNWAFGVEANGPLPAPKFAGQAISNTPQFLSSSSGFLGSGFNTAMTIFVVAVDAAGISDAPAIMVGDSASTMYFNHNPGSRLLGMFATYGGTGSNNGPPNQYTEPALGVNVYRYDGINVDVSFNGNRGRAAKSGNLGFSGDNIVIGNWGTALTGTYGYQGNIAEVLIYQAALTPNQIGEITNYLSGKWGILNSAGTVPLGSQVIALGNSLVEGYTGNPGSVGRWPAQDWPAQLSQYLRSNSENFQVINTGSPGRTTTWLLYYLTRTGYPYGNLINLFESSYANNIATFWEGTNDLVTAPGSPPSGGVGHNPVGAFNNIVTYCQLLLSYGYTVILLTILPRNPADYASTNPNFEQDREDVNNAIRALWQSGGTVVVNGNTYSCTGAIANALADVGNDPIIGTPATVVNNPIYYDTTLTHLTPAGHTIVASYVLAAMQSLITFAGSQMTVTLTGIGTNWSGSPFSLVSGPGTLLSQSVLSTTTATVTLGLSGLGPFTLTDGTFTFTVDVPTFTVGYPSIYEPMVATLNNAAAGFTLYPTDEALPSLYAILSDTPPSGTASTLNLIGATVVYKIRPVSSYVPILSNPARIANLNTLEVAYDFKSADLTLLATQVTTTPVFCHSAFVVTWPNGQIREFPLSQPLTLNPSAY